MTVANGNLFADNRIRPDREGGHTKHDWEARKAFVKSKADFEDVVVALDLLSEGAPAPDCPACYGVATLHACHAGKGFYCESCDEKGDMIALAQLKVDCGFRKAIEILEAMLPASRDGRTGELFGAGGHV